MSQSDHNTTGQAPDTSELPSKAKLLLQSCNQSTLATQSLKHPGFPFASVVPYALDDSGKPLFLISSMATHTKNLKGDSRACLLVEDSETGDRLAGGRVSVVGKVNPVPVEKIQEAESVYFKQHAAARQWASFGDFAWYCLAVEEIYIVAGFGSMGWVNAEDYAELFRERTEK